jgi:hypothetical protein
MGRADGSAAPAMLTVTDAEDGTLGGPVAKNLSEGHLAGLGEEQLRVDLGAGGVQAPVPLPVGPLDRWGWAGELLVGGGQPLFQRRLPCTGAELPGDVPDVAVGHAQAPLTSAGKRRRVRVAWRNDGVGWHLSGPCSCRQHPHSIYLLGEKRGLPNRRYIPLTASCCQEPFKERR